MATRSITDSQDHEKIWKIFDQFITKFDTANHPPELVHVASGKINCDKNVNVKEAVSLGILQLKYFCKKLSTGFHGMVVAVVKVKMLSGKKGMKAGDIRVYDADVAYVCIIRFLATGQTALETVLKHELAPVSPSMFNKEGDMLTDTQNHVLKEKLQLDVSHRSLHNTFVSIVDGCTTENMFKYVMDTLWSKHVYLVFNRYKNYIIKGSTQAQRAKNLAYQHNLVLTCTHSKIQLLDIIANYITKKVLDDAFRYIFIVTSYQDVSIQVSDGSITLKEDYWIWHI